MAIGIGRGFGVAADLVKEYSDRMVDVTPALHALRHIAINSSKEAFARQRDPEDNTRWPAIKASTASRPVTMGGRERGFGNILAPRPDKGSAMKNTIRAEAYRNQLIVGTNKVSPKGGFPYPLTHQFGTRPGKRPRVPQRRFLGFSEKNTEIIMAGVHEYITRGTVNGVKIGRRRTLGLF